MKNEGFSMVELVVVVTIIGILAITLGFSYQGWLGRYKVESAVKGLYSDMMSAQTMAMRRDIRYFVDFPSATTYRIIVDGNGDNKLTAGVGDTVQPQFPKTLDYPVTGAVTLTFDSRGLIYQGAPPGVLITAPVPIWMTSTSNPDYDCIMVSESRVYIGQMNGGACVVK